MALDFAATYKVLVLGDSNVGKTCIVHRYCDERYYDTYISTIGSYLSLADSGQNIFANWFKNRKLIIIAGIDFKQKLINLDGVPIKLQIWDTAGKIDSKVDCFLWWCHFIKMKK